MEKWLPSGDHEGYSVPAAPRLTPSLELVPLTAGAHDHPGGDAFEPRGGDASARPLTARQLEVLAHVARGRTNRMIGEILGISEKTVRNHLRTISHKLSTSDRTHAVVLAIGNGWIAIPIEPEGAPALAAEAAPQAVAAD